MIFRLYILIAILDTTREPGAEVYVAEGGLITLSPNKELKEG